MMKNCRDLSRVFPDDCRDQILVFPGIKYRVDAYATQKKIIIATDPIKESLNATGAP